MRSFAVVALTAVLAAAAPLSDADCKYAVKETHPVPGSFARIGDAPQDHLIRLSVGLKQSNFAQLERELYEVSDPSHPRYGQHLSQDDVNQLIKPSEESLELVKEWIHQHVHPDAIEHSSAGDFMTFTLPVASVEKMLDTKYSTYRHTDGFELVRTPQWSLPLNLHEHIATIQPTNAFSRPFGQSKLYRTTAGTRVIELAQYDPADADSKSSDISKSCHAENVTPHCLRLLYGTSHYKPKAGAKAQIALNDFLGEINNRSDAKLFLERFRPKAVGAAEAFKQISVAGGNTQQTQENATQLKEEIGIEGNLDVQTIIGQTYPMNVTAYSTGGNAPYIPDSLEPPNDPQNEPYLVWLNYILAQSDIPWQVISNSYADDEDTVPPSYAQSVCAGFAQLGARGVSVFFGSGDAGVEGVQPGGNCTLNTNPNKKAFIPCFPGSCPYVTTIGSTSGFSPEMVAFDPANGFRPGGGFSNYFTQPSWQKTAVENYLSIIGNANKGLFNTSGRAYPDLAAYGVNFTIAWNGTFIPIDGTSCSTPTAASIFALVNDARIAAGKSAMGWLNPWIYSTANKAFTDVTIGETKGCNTTGFTAQKGWDAASGWGTPKFKDLLEAAGVGSSWNH